MKRKHNIDPIPDVVVKTEVDTRELYIPYAFSLDGSKPDPVDEALIDNLSSLNIDRGVVDSHINGAITEYEFTE